MRPPRPRRSLFKQLLLFLMAVFFLGGIGFSIPAIWYASGWWKEAVEVAEIHRSYQVAHPGWSFPARVQTAAVPIEGTPKGRLVVEAKARGYTEDCKDTGPGEFCTKTGKVLPLVGNELPPIVLGELIGPDGEWRRHLPVAEAPKVLLDAILAAEDRDFYEHRGVNFKGLGRAILANAQEGGYSQGASTLSMQVVRNLVQRKEKTVGRKLKEMVMAMAIDDHLGKEGVLQMYLDAPYLGQDGSLSVCGFSTASEFYFGKTVGELSLAEAATLAAILPAPGRFSPKQHPELAKERRDRVLDAMQAVFHYDAAQITAAKAEEVRTAGAPLRPERYPAYLSATRAWLEKKLAPEVLYGAGLTVTVAMNVAMQEETDKLFSTKVPWLESIIGRRKDRLEAAGVFMDHQSGAILALWGGSDVTATSFNRATLARRQPGSSFKPVVYAMAFDQPPNPDGTPKFTAAHAEPNSPRVFKTPQGDWSPRNVGGEYSSTACLAQGLAWSQNIATASLLEEMGGPKLLKNYAKKLGFDTSLYKEEFGLALGQGEVTVLEMATFAGIVGNGGKALEGSPVLSAVDPAGLYRISAPVMGEQVMGENAAALTRELMRLVIDIGTGGAARGAGGEAGYAGPAMGKTGTTDKERDLWFIGATPKYSAALWLGYDQPAGLGWAASDLAAPLWGWWMGRITKPEAELPAFPKEPKLEFRSICKVSGRLSNGSCPLITAPFLPGTTPRGVCGGAHPPPVVEDPLTEPVEGETPEDGSTPAEGAVKKKHESLWKKRAREQEEAAAAAGVVPGAAPAPAPAPQ